MPCRRTGHIVAIIVLAFGSTQCHELARGLDEYCPGDPLTDGCDEGACQEFPCISYCLEHLPELSGAPASGLGAWCDDLGADFDPAAFCRTHPELDACGEWCAGQDGACECGDAVCSGAETFQSCPGDCPASCGNGACDGGETPVSCQADCEAACPDGFCSHDETAGTCPGDCFPACGDGHCTHDESATSCHADCPAACGDAVCSHSESVLTCPGDCPASCGDAACSHDEDAGSCPDDCPASCGDAACTHDEDAASCPGDCPPVCGDGHVTHDEQCEGDDARDCATGCGTTGTQACESCRWAACTPPPEACNALDEDCDGEIDEGFECIFDTIESCTTSCGSSGTMICDASCQWPVTCAPPAEACNAFDDDCDGTTDESCRCRSAWSTESPTAAVPRRFTAVWGSSWDDIFIAVNNGTMHHFDGVTWSSEVLAPPFGYLNVPVQDLSGSGPTDVFAAAKNGWVYHFDGRRWGPMSTHVEADLFGIWASGPDDVFAVGEAGTVIHFDGARWTTMMSHTSSNLNDVWGTDPDNAWAVGDDGTVIHYNGASWSEAGFTGTVDLYAVWGTSRFDVYIGGNSIIAHSYNEGDTWDSLGLFFTVEALWGFGVPGAATVYMVGSGGNLQRYDGFSGFLYDSGTWDPLSSPTTTTIYTVWGSEASNVYLVDSNEVFHRCGTGW